MGPPRQWAAESTMEGEQERRTAPHLQGARPHHPPCPLVVAVQEGALPGHLPVGGQVAPHDPVLALVAAPGCRCRPVQLLVGSF